VGDAQKEIGKGMEFNLQLDSFRNMSIQEKQAKG
jgi:hypothetical protein